MSFSSTEKAETSPESLTNYDLILRCQQGLAADRAAFTELLRRYQSHVDHILYHLAPDWQDRADLAQEVWIRVYRDIKRLNDPLKFRGWLSRIATTLFYDELRKRKRVSQAISLDAPRRVEDGEIDWDIVSDYPNPDENLATSEFYECLQTAIADLPEAFPILKTENADNVKQRIIQQAFDLFEDETETQRWLSTPKDGLDGQTPLEALATDAGSKKVEELLYRAEYGIFG